MGSRLHGNDRRRRGNARISVERETGIEPATLCLGSRCSTTELLPLTPSLVPPSPPRQVRGILAGRAEQGARSQRSPAERTPFNGLDRSPGSLRAGHRNPTQVAASYNLHETRRVRAPGRRVSSDDSGTSNLDRYDAVGCRRRLDGWLRSAVGAVDSPGRRRYGNANGNLRRCCGSRPCSLAYRHGHDCAYPVSGRGSGSDPHSFEHRCANGDTHAVPDCHARGHSHPVTHCCADGHAYPVTHCCANSHSHPVTHCCADGHAYPVADGALQRRHRDMRSARRRLLRPVHRIRRRRGRRVLVGWDGGRGRGA